MRRSEFPRAMGVAAAVSALALSLLLTECGSTADSGAGAGQSGANSAAGSGGSAEAAGASGAPPSEAGASGTREAGGLGGSSAAGSPASEGGAGGALAALGGAAGSGACSVELTSYTSPSALHVSVCSVIDYPMNPPVYGDHYPVWAAYKTYAYPVPLGFLVHDLEHGAIVLLYNCADGCTAEVAAAQSMIDALPADPRCVDPVKHQVILAPDPTLPTRWAAVAWGQSLAASCFTAPAFRAFYDANLAHGGEDLCADGADLAPGTCQ